MRGVPGLLNDTCKCSNQFDKTVYKKTTQRTLATIRKVEWYFIKQDGDLI
ncbi:hypothetical protein [Niabella agricola]